MDAVLDALRSGNKSNFVPTAPERANRRLTSLAVCRRQELDERWFSLGGEPLKTRCTSGSEPFDAEAEVRRQERQHSRADDDAEDDVDVNEDEPLRRVNTQSNNLGYLR